MTETLIIDPAKMAAQEFDPAVTPEWAALATYLKEAATAGKSVTLTAKAETLTPGRGGRAPRHLPRTVMRRIEGGEIAAIKKGSRYRIPLSEVERFR